MGIVFSVLFLLGFWIYYKSVDNRASNHCNTYQVDWEKVNEDRIKNNLSNTQVDKNIFKGKYNRGPVITKTEIKRKQDDTWKDFKKKHSNGSWN